MICSIMRTKICKATHTRFANGHVSRFERCLLSESSVLTDKAARKAARYSQNSSHSCPPHFKSSRTQSSPQTKIDEIAVLGSGAPAHCPPDSSLLANSTRETLTHHLEKQRTAFDPHRPFRHKIPDISCQHHQCCHCSLTYIYCGALLV